LVAIDAVFDVALDGVEALRLVQAGPYDLIVLDLMLPDGFLFVFDD
jgi:DNA-binding response OmpR family regulator